MIRLIRLVILALGLTTAAVAQPIPGAEAPGFVGARALWLAGDDLPALQALAGLAREGNTAAQMLLSQIATATWTHAHVTEGMERRARIALLRQEIGLSGRDWMQAAAENSPLAEAYWASRPTLDDESLIARYVDAFIASGDRRAAFQEIQEELDLIDQSLTAAAMTLAQQHERALGLAGRWLYAQALGQLAGFGPISPPKGVTSQAEFTAFLRARRTPETAFAANGMATIWMHFNRADSVRSGEAWDALPGYEDSILQLISAIEDTATIARFCAEECPRNPNLCQLLVVERFSHPTDFPYPLASPLPALIPDRAYYASDRILGDIRARLAAHLIPWQGCPG